MAEKTERRTMNCQDQALARPVRFSASHNTIKALGLKNLN